MLQHGGDDHEDDEQHQHHVDHGGDVDVGHRRQVFYFFELDFHRRSPRNFSKKAGEACASPSSSTRRIPYRKLLAGAGAALRPLQEVVDQFGTGVAHLDVEGFNLVGEIVEGPDGGQGDEQTDSGGHQGFRNTAGDGAEAGRLFRRNALERVDDADD